MCASKPAFVKSGHILTLLCPIGGGKGEGLRNMKPPHVTEGG